MQKPPCVPTGAFLPNRPVEFLQRPKFTTNHQTTIMHMSKPHLYSVEREFNVPVERLWRAWTDASELESWYHGTEHQSVKGATTSDLQIGGLWSCGVHVPGRDFDSLFFGKYTNIETNRSFEHTLHYTESMDEFKAMDFNSPSHLIRVEFEARGANSWCKFSQFGEAPAEQVLLMTAGIGSYFDSLEKHLATSN